MSELGQHLERLQRWLNLSPHVPSLFILQSDVIYMGIDRWIPKRKTLNQEQFEFIFTDLLNRGYPWINFHFDGILEGQILIIIELPGQRSGGPRGRTSVNLSGPPIGGVLQFEAT